MENRDDILGQKTREIQERLVWWARDNKVLKPGEQIEFALSIKCVPTVISREAPDDILSLPIKSVFTEMRCIPLGIKTHQLQNIRYLQRGDIITVCDLVQYCIKLRDIAPNRQKREKWDRRLEDVKRVLNSLGITI